MAHDLEIQENLYSQITQFHSKGAVAQTIRKPHSKNSTCYLSTVYAPNSYIFISLCKPLLNLVGTQHLVRGS